MKTSVATRRSIVALHAAGLTNGEVARHLNISKHTVALWLSRYQESGTISNKPKSGRPRCTTPQEDEAIRAVLVHYPYATATSIRDEHGLSCTAQTIRNRLQSMKLHHPHLATKPAALRTDHVERRRLQYALEYVAKPSAFWDNVIFCDEKFAPGDGKTTKGSPHQQDARSEEDPVVGSRKSGKICVGMFGWMHTGGVGELVDVGPRRFSANRYVEILEEVFLPSVRAMLFPGSTPFHLVQGNNLPCTAKVVQAWFRDHPEITVLPHPPSSPDLNPIEDVWAAVMEKFGADNHSQRKQVVNEALLAWEGLRNPAGQTLTEELVSCMPRRLNSVIEAGGVCT